MNSNNIIRTVILILNGAWLIKSVVSESGANEENAMLQEYILRGYNKNVRPVRDRLIPHHVRVQLFLMSLDDFDMKKQTVKNRLFLELKWTDNFLNWEPVQFKNTTRITIDSDLIWIPDLIIGNEEGPFTFIDYSKIGKAIVYNNGEVTVWPYLYIEVGCQIAITDYPFDVQSFHFRISSWGLTTKDLIVELDTNNVSYGYYQESGEWEITEYYADTWNRTIGFDLYSRVAYFLTVRRKSLYYVINVIGPLVVTSLLNTMCFILPVESAQRVTLSVSIFLSLAIFLSIISETLPRTSDGVSVTVIYLCLQVCGSFLTIAMNVFILNIYHHNESKKKSFLVQSMLQMSKNMIIGGWKNDITEENMEANENKTPEITNKRVSNGSAIIVDSEGNGQLTKTKNEEQTVQDKSNGHTNNTLQISRQSIAMSSSFPRRPTFAEKRDSKISNDDETSRKIPKIRSRSIKEEETVWTKRAHYLNVCSFWFSVLWNIGLIMMLVILPRV